MNRKILCTALLVISGTEAAQAKIIDEFLNKSKETLQFSRQGDKEIKRDSKGIDLRHTQDAFNESKPQENITRFDWTADRIFKIKMRLRMKTLIRLPEDDEIKVYTLGDNKSFRVTILGQEDSKNMLDVQSFYSGVDTNLTVVGESGRIYTFYLRSYAVQSKVLPDFIVYVDAPPVAPEKSTQYAEDYTEDGRKLSKKERLIKEIKASNDYLRELPETQEIFIDYKMYGDKDIAPYAVYDDGSWTYFDFREQGIVESGRLPVVYKVIDDFDSIVNTRIEGGFIIAESINMNWTIKNGEKTVCVKPISKSKFKKRFDKRYKK